MQWFHGTPFMFQDWANPAKPIVLPNQWNSKIVHSFVSLSADAYYASQYAGQHGHLCQAHLHQSANVLDLRYRSIASILLWKKLKQTFLGRQNQRIQTLNHWFHACHSGDIVGYVCDGNMEQAILNLTQSQSQVSQSSQPPLWALEDMKRAVIENTMRIAWRLGFEAVICLEKIETQSVTQLYVSNVEHLSPPHWISLASTTISKMG